jgi:hypothetical protein
MTETLADYRPDILPAVVVAYLDAHDEGRPAEAAATFTPDATVVDDGATYQGSQAIAGWLDRTSTEYSYTSTRIGQQTLGDSDLIVRVRLEGDFPGGIVTLSYRFRLEQERIAALTITAP